MIGEVNEWEIGFLGKDVSGTVLYYNESEALGKIEVDEGQKFDNGVNVIVLREDVPKVLLTKGQHVLFDVLLLKNNQRIRECAYKAKNVRLDTSRGAGPGSRPTGSGSKRR